MKKQLLQTKEDIRFHIRVLRKSLSLYEKYNESIKISEIACGFNLIVNAKNIAIFLPFDGEINTYPLIFKLWLNKINVFLPVIHPFLSNKLIFSRFTSTSILYYNKYKILEPRSSLHDIISISDLDVVIVPLVAFDRKGSRLGMGKGFYDIFLKNWYKKKFFPIGFAYSFQLVDSIPKKYWDISLPVVLTPKKIWFF